METIKIPFSGINRSIDDGISNDGQCMELINARIKNGSIEPIGNPILIANLNFSVNRIFYHASVNKIIAFASNEEVYVLTEDYTKEKQLSTDLNGSTHVDFLGNMACFLKGEEILYCIFDGDEYQYIGSIPELPPINITQSLKATSICPDSQFLGGRKSGPLTDDEFMRTAEYAAVGYYDNCIDTLNKDGFILGPCLLKYAFRTSTGGYIKESSIIIVENCTKLDYTFIFKGMSGQYREVRAFYQKNPLYHCDNEPNNSSFKDYTYEFGVMGTKIGLSFDNFDLSYLKSLIVSIDIFISPIDWFEKKEIKRNSISYSSYERIENTDEEQILKAYRFYKVAEYSLKGEEKWKLDNWSIDSISMQEQLVTSETKHSFSSKISYVYNSRLHLANINYSFFKGYNHGYESLTQDSSTEYLLTICTALNTEQGETIVKKTLVSKSLITPFLTYPDSRAHTMTIFITNRTGNGDPTGIIYTKEFQLKKHPYLDLAYYCSPTDRWRYRGSTHNIIPEAYYISIYENGNVVNFITEEKNNLYVDANVLKVSSLNNPASFPAKQTYTPSLGEIIGLCSNTTALSQGQFGQHPLYVFSKDGIYAMSIGGGDVIYSTQTPVTRDVCINPKSIKGIDKAVIFASKRGIMIISGNITELLSEEINGYLPSCTTSSPIINKIANTWSFHLSEVEFIRYIEKAEVGYNYQENEIIIANGDCEYAYVFNLNSKMWSKISYSIKSFTNKYPECYSIINNAGMGVFDMQNNHRSVSKILLLTKPIKMGSNSHKRILQTALRGIVKRALSDLYLRGEPVMFRGDTLNIFSDVGFYILGSNDAEHFTLISGKESIVDIRDLVTKMNKSKPYKYFMVALAGGVRTDVSLNYMEFIASESFANRLR